MPYSNFYFCLLFIATLFLSGCQTDSTSEEKTDIGLEVEVQDILISDQQFKQAEMELGTLQNAFFTSTIQSTGKIEVPASNQLKVSAYAGGYVGNFDLTQGQSVRKGQLLFTLENPAFIEMQQSYLETQAQLSYLRSDYERQKQLVAENVAAEKNFLKVESEYKAHLAQLEGLKKRLQLLKIDPDKITPENLVSTIAVYSPTSGYIAEVRARQGMFLNPTDVAVELINTDHLHLELFIFEKDILKVRKGQKVQFRLPEASTETYEAEVYLIGRILDEERRVVQVHAHLSKAVEKAVSIVGMYVEAKLFLDKMEAKSLPEDAVVYEDEQAYVLVQREKSNGQWTFEKRLIDLGKTQDGQVQILNPQAFATTDQILIKGAFNLVGIE